MEARRRTVSASACDDARLRASLELDGELDDLGRLHLRRHLESCARCARDVEGMRAASSVLRSAPLERYACGLAGARVLRSCGTARGRHWVGAAVAVVALVLATGALPRSDDAHVVLGRAVGAAPGRPAPVMPLKLPIGQRSAVDDFLQRVAGGPGAGTEAPGPTS
jgi:anti-sigma factor RsiW